MTLRNSTTTRFALIGLVALAMLIPLAMVEGVGDERQAYFDGALAEVAGSWGGAQVVSGPFLMVPESYRVSVKTEDGRRIFETRHRERVYLPGTLALGVEVDHQMRHRAIYDVPVYTAVFRYSGTFPATGTERSEDVSVHWDRARLVVGISQPQAISTASDLVIGGETLPFRGRTGNAWIASGVQAALPASLKDRPLDFEFEVTLKGSREIGFTPVGGITRAEVAASWPHPGFQGEYLPERYEIDASGFRANWQVHELARSLPAQFVVEASSPPLATGTASVRLFQPVTEYRLVDRAIKYGLLFIALTFLGFICFELTLGLRFHPVQYGVVGLGLVLFYLALLSLSEHVSFGAAYLIATLVLCALVGGYVRAMTRTRGEAGWLWMVLIVAALYGTLYVLLRLEDFALLVGTAVLFLGLAALMFSTRALADDPADG